MSLHIALETTRTVTTAAATMRTLVTATTSPAMDIAVWRTDLPAGSVGPRHAIDGDQIVVVVSGALAVQIGETAYQVGTGDAIALPAGSPRAIAAAGDQPATTITAGHPRAFATVGDGRPVEVPWTT